MGNTQDSRPGNLNYYQDPTSQNIAAVLPPDGSDSAQSRAMNYSEKDLEYVEFKETDEAYGEIRVYRLNENHSATAPEGANYLEIGIKSKIFDSQEESTEYLHGLSAKKALKHPHVVPFLKVQSVTNSNLCTSIYKIDIALEYNRNNLEAELLHRFTTKEFFAEANIFDMIEQVMSGLKYLKQNNIVHGDIQPRTILFGPNDEFKITDVQFLTNGMCGYRKHLAGIETECFLAPEFLQPLRRQMILSKGDIDQERADVFSLGLVALAASILQSVESVYNFEDYCLREEEVLKHLDIVKTHYSNDLYLLLVSMLNQVDRRVDLDTGLHLISQMRSGTFNQEEYERERFQQEIQNSQSKLAQSGQQNIGLDRPNANPDTAQLGQNPSNPMQPTLTPVITMSLPSKPQTQPLPSDRELAYAQEQEIIKRATQGNHNNTNNLNNYQIEQPLQQLQQQQQHQLPSGYQQHQPNQQQLLTPQQYLQENLSNTNNNSNFRNPLTPANDQQRKSDRYDSYNQPIYQSAANSKPNTVNDQHLAQQLPANSQYPSNVYQNTNSYPGVATAPINNNNNISNNPNTHNLEEIDARVREALLRSQQVSLKFENSPLRQFRDQLLADELYIPQDANQSQLARSRGEQQQQQQQQQYQQQQQQQYPYQSSSVKTNPTPAKANNYSNYQANGNTTATNGFVGAPVRKFVVSEYQKKPSQQGSKFTNQKWKI